MDIEIGTILFDARSGNYFRVDSEYKELQNGYFCTMVEVDEDMNVTEELSSGWQTKAEISRILKDMNR